jgi:hypothetical protein
MLGHEGDGLAERLPGRGHDPGKRQVSVNAVDVVREADLDPGRT